MPGSDEMRTTMRKPVAIWLLQIVCALAALMFLHGAYTTSSAWRATAPGEVVRVAYLSSVLLQLLFATLWVVTVFASQRRAPFGRWLGAALMASLAAILGYGVNAMPFNIRGSVMALFLVLSAALIWFATFSKAARAWYARS
jgi:hypothetical protein